MCLEFQGDFSEALASMKLAEQKAVLAFGSDHSVTHSARSGRMRIEAKIKGTP
jgi:hypothetical protein